MQGNYKGKIAVITGGTKGIGRALVEKFAAEGFTVATCARNKIDCQQLGKLITSKYGIEIMVIPADLSLKEDVKLFADAVLKLGLPIEVLINNTGVFIPGLLSEEEDGALEKMMETNLYSAYRLTRLLVPELKAHKHGHIFNICSIASIQAYPNGGSYSISKFALYGFSKVLREELKESGIRVTSVLPGATLTASWDGIELPADRFMPPEDIAEAIWNVFGLSQRTVVEDLVVRPQLGDIV